jgi:hypothetical protein
MDELHRKVIQHKLRTIREERSKEMAKHESNIDFVVPSTPASSKEVGWNTKIKIHIIIWMYGLIIKGQFTYDSDPNR